MTVIIIYVLYGYLETFGHWIFQSVEEEQQGRTARNETHPSLRNILQRAKNYCGRSQSSLRITFDHDLSLRFEMAFCIKQNYIMFNFRAQAHNGKTTLMQYCIIDFVIVRQMENGQQSVKKKTKCNGKCLLKITVHSECIVSPVKFALLEVFLSFLRAQTDIFIRIPSHNMRVSHGRLFIPQNKRS